MRCHCPRKSVWGRKGTNTTVGQERTCEGEQGRCPSLHAQLSRKKKVAQESLKVEEK